MVTHYLNIETTGLDPEIDRIITVQYQELERSTGRPLGNLTVLKSWDMPEDEMLAQFATDVPVYDPYPFAFVPVGYNLVFEHAFLRTKSLTHDMTAIDLLARPCLDLHGTGILMNGGEFRGSGLDRLTAKRQSGCPIPDWYGKREYDLILSYIQDEAAAFIDFYMWLLKEMPGMRVAWDEHRKQAGPAAAK